MSRVVPAGRFAATLRSADTPVCFVRRSIAVRGRQLFAARCAVVLAGVLGHAGSMAQSEPPGIPGIVTPECSPPRAERPWLDATQAPECRALEALAVLTDTEKMYWGGLFGATAADGEIAAASAESAERKLGLPRIGGGGDGPNGIADMSDLFGSDPAPRSVGVTAFPNVITLGATWDVDLARRYGEALGEEFRGKGMTSNLGPTLNLIRSWHGGRSAETYSEDPYLLGELAAAEIEAMQGQGVVATLKHFVANNQEFGRVGEYPDNAGTDTIVSRKALEEIYFPGFRKAVVQARAGAVMCAYNKVNGEFSCNSRELLSRLRDWGFDGYIVPDAAYALRDAVAAAAAGVTSASPVEQIADAIASGRLDPHFFDRKVYYTLVTRFRHGLYDGPGSGDAGADVSTPGHVALAREIAAAGAVLLRNDAAVLPLTAVSSIAVIGADAGPEAVVMETGSPNVNVARLSVPIDAIRSRAGAAIDVTYVRGSAGVRALPPVPASVFVPPSGEGHGLLGTYYHTPWFWPEALSRVDEAIDFGADPGIPAAPDGLLGVRKYERGRGEPWSARWTGTLEPERSGEYAFSLSGAGTAELYVDSRRVATIQRSDFPSTAVGTVTLEAGRAVDVLIKYHNASALLGHGIRLGWLPPDDRRERAVAAAAGADVAVVFAGEQLGEGYDKHFFDLPGDQNALISAVAAANPRTIVVLHTSTAVGMPWLDDVAAVIEAWYPGQEAGSSIAAVLFGDVNPSGRLPVTFPQDGLQGPGTHWMSYPGDGRNVVYDEGIFVGYRWYEQHDEEPLFPFGHGLSYTRFAYSRLELDTTDSAVGIRLRLRNTGNRAGAEVVQVYVDVPVTAGEPPKQLKAFRKVYLEPGETQSVELSLSNESLQMFDDHSGQWMLFPGAYEVMVGASSRDIRLTGGFARN